MAARKPQKKEAVSKPLLVCLGVIKLLGEFDGDSVLQSEKLGILLRWRT